MSNKNPIELDYEKLKAFVYTGKWWDDNAIQKLKDEGVLTVHADGKWYHAWEDIGRVYDCATTKVKVAKIVLGYLKCLHSRRACNKAFREELMIKSRDAWKIAEEISTDNKINNN